MKTFNVRLRRVLPLVAGLLCIISTEVSGQLTYLSTIPPFNGGNGSSLVTFNVKAHNTLKIREMYCSFTSATAQSTIIWYRTDSINGVPNVSTASGWIQAHTYTHTPAITGNGTMVIISDTSLNILIPAGETYGFAISGSSVRYSGTGSTPMTPYLIADANMHINTGPDVGYGGTLTSTIAFRHYNGQIGYELVPQETDAGLQAILLPGDTVCSGMQPVSVVLENNGPSELRDVEIHWSINQVSQPTYNWSGNLAPNNTATVTIGNYAFNTGTTYDIITYTSNPNNLVDTANANDTLIRTGIFVKPTPTAIPADTILNICAGDTVNLSFTLTGTSPWDLVISDGTINHNFNQVTNSGFSASFTPSSFVTYTLVSLSDATGCENTANSSITVSVQAAPPANITAMGPPAACLGDSVMLMGSVGLNFTYQWYHEGTLIPGETNYLLAAKTGGNYTVLVTSPIGCSNLSAPYTVYIHPLPMVSLGNDTALLPHQSILLNAGAGFNSYLWSTGATSASLLVDTAGAGIGVQTIWVNVTDNNTCKGGDTILINFTPHPGIAGVSADAYLELFPNPTTGRVTLHLNRFPAGKCTVELFGPDGRAVFRKEHTVSGAEEQLTLDLQHLPAGVYHLRTTHVKTASTMQSKLLILK
jgi:hypothetical protein